VVPSVVVWRQPVTWLFAMIVGVASPFAYLLSLYCQPYVTVARDLKNDTTWYLFTALLVLMVMAGLLAMAMRSSYQKKRWEGISLFVVGYLFVMGGAFAVTWYPLFFE
jgi:peptidoglycan/LPS O-acetylase OafA/YrhL